MTLSTQPYKGARDFYPEDKRIQNYLFGMMRKVAESYGYEEYDAPIIEPLELFLAKSSEEIVNEQTYAFEDRGGRSVVIRPEMTPTVSRLVAGRRQELGYPLRLYSIPNLWRYERPQRGRLREHWQLNIDIFGVPNLFAEHELIQLADNLLKSFGAKSNMYKFRINSRKFVNQLFKGYFNLNEAQTVSIIRLIDRIDKMEPGKFSGLLEMILTPSQRESGLKDKILNILKVKFVDDLPNDLLNYDSISEINSLLKLLEKSKITNVEFDISLMRGFDYYTDIVFEAFDTNPENNRAMFGGGRYDGLVALFGVDPVPTVGFGLGDVTLENFLDSHGLLPLLPTETELYAVMIGDVYEKSIKILNDLRSMGLNVAVDSSGNKVDKQLKTAYKKNVKYVIFIGEEEIKNNQFKLKNLLTQEEEIHSLERIVSLIKDNRQK